MVRSANCTICAKSMLEALLLETLSVQVHATMAWLFTLGGALTSTFTFSVIAEVPFTAIGVVVSMHVTFCPMALHDHPVPVPLANVSPDGSVSVTVTVPVVAAEPPLVTAKVNCAPCWPCAKLPVWDFAIVRSGNCVMLV